VWVNRCQRYSVYLGLEIPCILTYTIENKNEFAKTIRQHLTCLKTADCVSELISNLDVSCVSEESTLLATMKFVCSSEGSVSTVDPTAHYIVLKLISLTQKEAKGILKRRNSSGPNYEMNLAQELLKVQYPKLNGLQSTLFQKWRCKTVSLQTACRLFPVKHGITG